MKMNRFVHQLIGKKDREYTVVLFLDNGLKVTGYEIVTIGSNNYSTISIPEVFKTAIKTNACSIIFAHNHPGGNPKPSEDDIIITRRIKDAGEILQIKLTDHIIVTPSGEFFSFVTNGLLK